MYVVTVEETHWVYEEFATEGEGQVKQALPERTWLELQVLEIGEIYEDIHCV